MMGPVDSYHLQAIHTLLEKILERMPEPHEHDFRHIGDTSYNCWCGKPPPPPPPRCGKGFGPWVNDQRPMCQEILDHEGACR